MVQTKYWHEEVDVTKWKILLLLMVVVICAVVFQLFIRYKDVEVGAFDLRYDRLTSEAFFRVATNEDSRWQKLGNVDSYRKAKYILDKRYFNMLLADVEFKLDQVESDIGELKYR
jgi:hypothetical protein